MEERCTLVVNESASVEEGGRKAFFEVPSSPWWDAMDIYEVDVGEYRFSCTEAPHSLEMGESERLFGWETPFLDPIENTDIDCLAVYIARIYWLDEWCFHMEPQAHLRC
jgi:hypothetical protein